ncbi:MAG TPA: hypothetical protein VFQ53_12725 [Kofleriaceae bacterium]|nr:hypothetical protein [Kofleriaceae bacterium]
MAARHDALAAEVATKTRELEQATQLLEDANQRAKLPVLDNIRVAAPCSAEWSKMTGDDHVRHCGDCNKNVFNLSELTRDEAEALIIEHEGKLCVRYYQRKDGTILTRDCTIGIARRRRRRLVAAGAAAMLVGGGALVWRTVRAHEQRLDDVLLGTMAIEQVPFEPPRVEFPELKLPAAPEVSSEPITVTAGAVAMPPDFEIDLREARKRKHELEQRLEHLRKEHHDDLP